MKAPFGFRLSGLAVVVVLVAACASAGSSGASPSGGASTQPSTGPAQTSSGSTGAALFQVVRVDGSSAAVSLHDLEKLPQASIMSFGNAQEGPSLIDVLHAAGVTDFATVTLTGSNGTKTLNKADVTTDVILAFNNRGTVKLVSPSMSKDQRILDVSRIAVA